MSRSARFVFSLLACGLACTDATPGVEPQPATEPDAGLDGGTLYVECDDWCRLEADCRLRAALDWLGQHVVDAVAECGYHDEAALRSECVDECNVAIDAGATFLQPCFACVSSILSMSCDLDAPSGACRSACNSTGPFWYPLTGRIDERLACWLGETSIPMPQTCERGPLDPHFYGDPTQSYSGLARVLDPSLTLLLENGSTLTVHGTNLEYPPLIVGSTVAIEFISDCPPFFCTQSLVLRDMQDNLQFAAWKGHLPPVEPVLPEIELSYDHARCTSIPEACGYWIGLDLLARSGLDRAGVHVPAGREVELRGFRIVNGQSGSLFLIDCTDTGGYEVTGFLRRL